MSSNDRTLDLISRIAFASDGLVSGLALAYLAVETWRKYIFTSSALRRVRRAQPVQISDLRSILASSDSDDEHKSVSDSSLPNLVVVRGLVKPRSSVDGNWMNSKSGVVTSINSDEPAVVLQKSQTYMYNLWTSFLGRRTGLQSLIFGRFLKEQKCISFRMVPFVLAENSHSDYAVICLEGSKHALPLITSYQHLQSIPSSPYTILQAFLGQPYPVGLLNEEKILPIGKEVTAVGACYLKDGIPQIESCKDIPYFLSDMTKDQMEADLASETTILFWGGIFLGSVSLGILGYAINRNWRKWYDWWQQRRLRQSRNAAAAVAAATALAEDQADEMEEIPDGQLCVVCLTRRRRSAFVPCGHRVCCHRCALSVERDLSPKCPICRQTIRSSVIVFES
ncbi:hypothetical protein Syun_030812 [Stephania yunnanensis]|uniref:RING-type E3 ubiquitin transferase n=1 Tax=Stephania yunnanensis TaxID=152371 RepID=A0AAP0E2H1_9MAGN